jgi:hypothetical protein
MPSNAAAAVQIDRSELIVGRYRPVRPLGAGGSGQVWLALDEDLGREVALKIVPRQGRASQRAEREAEAVSRLRHPGCARSLSLAEDHEHVYLVYEYIPGRTLRDALRTRQLTDAQMVEITAQLLETLAHAHAEGIVHRDVKPTNVILEEGPGVRVRLLDFGLALIDDIDPLTAEGDVPGTLAYISPERLDGTEATEGADVWAAGLILWEGLCGRHPFFGESYARTTERIMAGPGSIAEERPELPRALVEAVDSAFELDPSKRPSPGELASRLREIADRRRRPRHEPRRKRLDRREAAGRVLHGALAGSYVAAMLVLFTFLPQSFTLPIALLVGLAAFARPQLGLGLALAIPILPLGDVAIGLAGAYAAAAAGWLYLYWRQPRAGAAFVLGPPLAAVGLLGLFPFGTAGIRGALQRAFATAGAVAAACGLAALSRTPLPFVGGELPAGLGITASDSPTAVVVALASYAWSQPALLAVTAVLTLVAVLSPLARHASVWQLSIGGVLLIAATLLVPTLAFGTDVHPSGVIIAIAIGVGLLARPAFAAIREGAPARKASRRQETAMSDEPRPKHAAAMASGRARRFSLRRRKARTQPREEKPVVQEPGSVGLVELGPIVTDPVSLEEAWSNLVDAAE